MHNLKKYSHFFLLAVLALFVASCEKRDANLTTDFESNKAKADKLVTEVNEGLSRMETEHADMMSDLDSAGKASKDSAKVNGVREDMNRHMEQSNRVKALVDSVSVYKAMTPENDDQMRAANDRLGTHTADLEREWKTLQDQHAKLQQDILSFSVDAAGQAVLDSSNAAGSNNTASGGKSSVDRPTPSKNTGGTPRNPTSSGGVSRPEPSKNTGGVPRSTSSGQTQTQTGTREEPAKNTGGAPRRSGGSATTKE